MLLANLVGGERTKKKKGKGSMFKLLEKKKGRLEDWGESKKYSGVAHGGWKGVLGEEGPVATMSKIVQYLTGAREKGR